MGDLCQFAVTMTEQLVNAATASRSSRNASLRHSDNEYLYLCRAGLTDWTADAPRSREDRPTVCASQRQKPPPHRAASVATDAAELFIGRRMDRVEPGSLAPAFTVRRVVPTFDINNAAGAGSENVPEFRKISQPLGCETSVHVTKDP